jgi:hypothetical protein
VNLHEYRIDGDPTALLAVWEKEMAPFGDELVVHLVTSRPDGITIIDACPTEADFQGWINGDDWARIKKAFGVPVEVTALGDLHAGVVRQGAVRVTQHAHA